MKKTLKRALSLFVACMLLAALATTCFAETAGFADMFKLQDASVTVDGTADKQAEVIFEDLTYTNIFTGLEAYYPTSLADGKITLTAIDSPSGLPFKLLGKNTVKLDTGYFLFGDEEQQTSVAAGDKLSRAVYSVDKDTPTGDYAVEFLVKTLGDWDLDSVTNVKYYATIHVTNTNCTHTAAVKTDAVAATCTDAGTEAYWTCPDCGKMFSDEACTAVITKAVAIPATGHNYVNDVCTACGAAKPSMEFFLDVIPADADGNGYGEVSAAETFTVTLNARAETSTTLDGFAATVNYDADHLTLVKVEAINNTSKTERASSVRFYSQDARTALTAGTPAVLATFTFTVKDGAANGDKYDIAIDTAKQLSATFGGNSDDMTPNTDASDKGVEISSTTMTFLKEDGSELEVITQPVGTAVTAPDAPDKAGYDFVGWDADDDGAADTVPATMPEADATYKPIYKAQDHKITLDPDNGEDAIVIPGKTDDTVTPPADPDKTGYEFKGWDTDGDGEPDTLPTTIPAEDLTGKAVWSTKEYTITYDAQGGTATPASATYTIEDALTIATATKEGSTFTGWKVTAAEGSWVADTLYNADQAIAAGMYGDVTLTAQWNITATFTFDDYAYATSTQVLLIVDAAKLDSGCYLFDGQPLYWTDSTDYGANGAYITLVEYANYENLSAVELGKLLTVGDAATEQIDRDGDVNNDGKVNNTDATIVYQMLTKSGDYYTRLTVKDRLECDMVTATANATYRGSIADVNAIIDIMPD